MVSPIDPVIKSLEALNVWSSSEDQILVEKEGVTSDGKKVRYLAPEKKPSGFRVLLDNILNFFGCRIAWKLNNVFATLLNVLSEKQDLKPFSEEVTTKLFRKVDHFNTHHHGKIKREDITKLKALSVFQTSTAPAVVAVPTTGQTAPKAPQEPTQAAPIHEEVVLQQPPVQSAVNSSGLVKTPPTSSELWAEFRRRSAAKKEAQSLPSQAEHPVSLSLAPPPMQSAAIPPAVREPASVEGQAGKPTARLEDQRKDRAHLPKGKRPPSREFLHRKPQGSLPTGQPVAPASSSVQEKKVVTSGQTKPPVSNQQPPKKVIGGQRMIPAFDPQQVRNGLRKTKGPGQK